MHARSTTVQVHPRSIDAQLAHVRDDVMPALLAAGDVDTAIDPAALHHYMSWHAGVPAPLTILKGIRKLAPATILTLERDGTRREEIYWTVTIGPREADRGMTEADMPKIADLIDRALKGEDVKAEVHGWMGSFPLP